MTENERKLTRLECDLLRYISFRTKNNHKFYETNETVAKKLKCAERTAQELINRLIREGYLMKDTIKGVRHLTPTNKANPITYRNFADENKADMKGIIKDLSSQLEYYKQQYANAEAYSKNLRNDLTKANKTIDELTQRIINLTQINKSNDLNNALNKRFDESLSNDLIEPFETPFENDLIANHSQNGLNNGMTPNHIEQPFDNDLNHQNEGQNPAEIIAHLMSKMSN